MGSFIDIAEDVLLDAVVDTAYLLPFLFATYLLLEWLEHRAGAAAQRAVRNAGAAGPVVGAVAGVVPQCGFSAAAATLYAGRIVSIGTLFAVFLSTSDEMLPLFVAAQVPLATMARILGAKAAIGAAAGLVVDGVVRVARRALSARRRGADGDAAAARVAGNEPCIHELCERDHCRCGEGRGGIVRSALVHTLQVALFVFLVTVVIDALIEVVGQDALARFMGDNEALSVFAAALVGLVPNCAASVVVAQLYLDGVLGAGAMLAGLLTGAGVGMLVLLRTNRRPRENVCIVAALYAIGVACGLAAGAIGVVF